MGIENHAGSIGVIARNEFGTRLPNGAVAGPDHDSLPGTQTTARVDFKSAKVVVGVLLALWLALVVYLGAHGAFVTTSGTVPFPIAIAVGAPFIVFLLAFWLSDRFRHFLMAADLPLVTAVQSWRFAGFGFLALYVHGVLPGAFAWSAGLGDMAIGLSAPWLALAVARRPGFATSRRFVIWNLLGILDLVAAVSDAAINRVLSTGAPGEITVGPMAELPLLLIPAYLVPLFLMLHVTALFQARQLAQIPQE